VSNITTEEIVHFQENPNVRDNMETLMIVIINRVKTQITKKGSVMAFLDIEDMRGGLETIVFPNTYEKCKNAISVDSAVVLRGRLNFKDEDTPKIIAEKITPIGVAVEFYNRKERDAAPKAAVAT
jgi:DNA polymerase-3 subunit alpha